MTKQQPKAYSYTRFSTPEQEKGDSLRRQNKQSEKYAEASGAVSLDALKEALKKFFGEKRADALEINVRAFEAGAAAVSDGK